MANISIDQLAHQIAEELKTYSQEIVSGINTSSEKIGNEAVKQLRVTSPKDRGKYAKAWAMATERATGQPSRRIIHVRAPYYRLAHLLEHGHAKRGGGRVSARPHIRKAEEQVISTFTEEVENIIRNGGWE